MDARYWQNRYQSGNIPWDIGGISPAMMDILTQLQSKDLSILIPGAGNGHEAIWLHHQGFNRVTVCDWAPAALQNIRSMCPEFPEEHLIEDDFFLLKGQHELILEQTFLSALPPEKWSEYINLCADLLVPKGYLTGLLFATPFTRPGPPFGATKQQYINLFARRFTKLEIQLTHKSIKPRLGNELIFKAQK